MSKSSWDPRTARAFLATVIPIVRVAAWAGHTLQLAERGGERCGGPVLLAGLVLGLGVVELSSGALGQTSRFSLELLSLLVLQLLGPMLVTLIAMALLLPSWLERGLDRRGSLGPSLLASALVGALLLLLFLTAALTGGVLASPRADLVAELRDVLAGVLLSDLLRSTLRAAFFLAVLCGWSQIRGGRRLRRDLTPAAEHRHQPAARECRHRTGSPRHAPPAQPHRQQRRANRQRGPAAAARQPTGPDPHAGGDPAAHSHQPAVAAEPDGAHRHQHRRHPQQIATALRGSSASDDGNGATTAMGRIGISFYHAKSSPWA